jgi:hypothetical protein
MFRDVPARQVDPPIGMVQRIPIINRDHMGHPISTVQNHTRGFPSSE